MIDLPDPARAFEYENGFYLTCAPSRLAKLAAHYELCKSVSTLPGAIVECGVFKGASFARLAMFRDLFSRGRKMVGFDTFGAFPATEHEADQHERAAFIAEAGDQSIGVTQLQTVLKSRWLLDVELVAGDICETVPQYAKAHPEFKISLLHLDVDIYEPSVTVLEHLYPRLVSGGVLVLDDYGVFPGETLAVDDYFGDIGVNIERFPFAAVPAYVRKP